MHPSLPFLVFFNIVCLFNLNFHTFSHPFSPSKHKLTLYGDAFFLNNTISLTHHQPPCLSSSSSSSQAKSTAVGIGRALYLYPVKFLEPSSNTTASFSCRFSFSIIASSDSCPFGDGFAFLITSNADSIAFSNGFMGLPDPTTLNPQDSFIAVEFDTGFNPAHGDINDNHIGIDLNSLVSFASVDAISKGIDLKSGREMMAWIEYTDVLKLFRVWVGFSAVKPARPVLATQIDLSEKFKEYMHVGFSASNGASGSALHIIKSWKFRTFGSYQDSIQEEEQDEDCLVCSSEDSRNSSNSRKIHSKGLNFRVSVLGLQLPFLNLLLVLAAIAIFSSFILFSLIRGKRVNQNPVNQEEEGEEDEEEEQRNSAVNRMPGRLSLAEIKSATMGFHENKKIGQGASATVYKGSIPSVGPVAVKRFDRGTWPHCNRNPFTTEFTTMTGYLRHKNLVQFQGWCCEGTETALVFEYLPNGSLDNFLHKKPDSEILSWNQRVNIILGVASALTYLHEECERQIIHRDVKCCNIMLDSDFNAKLGDFGLAEVYEHSSIVAGRNSTIPAGTMGYLAPEYVYSGIPSEKSDVYSFGIVVLEICSGHRPVEEDGRVLVEWIWSLWEKGKVVEAADMRLRGEFDAAEMERVVMVGMVCAHPNCEERPSVKEAARIIRGEAPPPVLPARRPTFRIRSVAVMPEEGEEVGRYDYHGDFSPSVEDFPWMTPRSQFS